MGGVMAFRSGALLLPTCVCICAAFQEGDGDPAMILPAADSNAGVRLLRPAGKLPGGADKRLFGILPNYRAEDAKAEYKPLKTWEKFKIAERDTFDWPNYFVTAGFALQTQIASGGWRSQGGLKGFGKYYVRSYGDQMIGNFITEAAMPSLLHEDPRYFRLGAGTLWKRAAYSSSRIFITKSENGSACFNFSEILGNTAVTAVTSIYYPANRTLSGAGERIMMQLGNDVINNLLTEFWPDIKHRLRFHRPPA